MTQRYPAVLPDTAYASAIAGQPRYGTAGDWVVGTTGLDPGRPDTVTGLVYNKATVSLASDSGGAAAADYTPRTQTAKLANIAGQTAAIDITDPRGSVGPGEPYPASTDPALAAPTVTSLAPNTAAATVLPIWVTVTGTKFTPTSTVFTGGASTPEASATYVNATTIKVPIWKASAGTVSVAVMDHSVLSNTNVVFTVT